MHRTQVYLDDIQYQLLRTRAARDGKSLACILREILDDHFGIGPHRKAEDSLDEVIGIGRGEGGAVAENYEDFLYGKKP